MPRFGLLPIDILVDLDEFIDITAAPRTLAHRLTGRRKGYVFLAVLGGDYRLYLADNSRNNLIGGDCAVLYCTQLKLHSGGHFNGLDLIGQKRNNLFALIGSYKLFSFSFDISDLDYAFDNRRPCSRSTKSSLRNIFRQLLVLNSPVDILHRFKERTLAETLWRLCFALRNGEIFRFKAETLGEIQRSRIFFVIIGVKPLPTEDSRSFCPALETLSANLKDIIRFGVFVLRRESRKETGNNHIQNRFLVRR